MLCFELRLAFAINHSSLIFARTNARLLRAFFIHSPETVFLPIAQATENHPDASLLFAGYRV